MKAENRSKRSKGGRPKKPVKRDQLLGIKCSLLERTLIEHRAEKAGQSVSEYLRTLALNARPNPVQTKVLPKEVLLFTGTLNHLAANLNQIAYRRNRGDAILESERLEILLLMAAVKQLATDIKNHLK
jgi:hypothetical protein